MERYHRSPLRKPDLDSIDYQNFLAALSTEHASEIPERDVAGLRSMDDLVGYIAGHAQPWENARRHDG